MNLRDQSLMLIVVPPAGWSLLRLRLKLSGLALGLAGWTALILWTGLSAGRRVDYWATKADNGALRGRVERLHGEVARSRDDLRRVTLAERQLRSLLELGGPDRILGAVEHSAAPAAPTLDRETRDATASLDDLGRRLIILRELRQAVPRGRPAEGRLTSGYGYRFRPLTDAGGGDDDDEFHQGLDVANRRGTTIRATADGVVGRVGWSGGYGRMVYVDHGHGFSTLYGHASELLVRRGQKVRRGDAIARMGSSGRSTGSHVHYEVWRNGKPVNPSAFLPDPASAR